MESLKQDRMLRRPAKERRRTIMRLERWLPHSRRGLAIPLAEGAKALSLDDADGMNFVNVILPYNMRERERPNPRGPVVGVYRPHTRYLVP
jgi:hypothetical protein